MPSRSKGAAVVVTALCLVLAACGSRLDHDAIVGASAGTGTSAGDGVTGADGGVATGGPGTADGQPGATGSAVPGAGPGQTAGAAATNGPAAGAKPAAGGPIVIGTIGTYSGGAADALGPGARALQAWAATVNGKGGLSGRQVKVIVMDDGGDPGRAKSEMQQLVEQDNVVAVVAAMGTTETVNAWKGYAESKGVPVIGSECGAEWSQASPVFFRQCPSAEALTFGTARIGAQFGKGKTFGGLFCSETSSCSAAEQQLFTNGDAQKAGLNPVYDAKISVFQTDFTSQCLQARNDGVQLLMVIADSGTVNRVASSCNRQNYNPQFLQLSATVAGDTVTKTGLGDMLLGMPVFPFAGLATPAFQEFDAAWKRYGGGAAASAAASLGWTSAKLFEKAATSAGGDISRAGLIKALRGLRGERLGGLTVPLTFGPQGTANVNCIYFMRGANGSWTAPDADKPECW
jgi:branched-chain amino acid transport system substrate-binding protein